LIYGAPQGLDTTLWRRRGAHCWRIRLYRSAA